ncbi:hypothetical protein KCU78_g3153, partial [Aureobasidium melanogenum]
MVVVSKTSLEEGKTEVVELNPKLDKDDELGRLNKEFKMLLGEADGVVALDKDDEVTESDVAVGAGGVLTKEEFETLVDDAIEVVLPDEKPGTLLLDNARADEKLKLNGDEVELDGREFELDDKVLENVDGAGEIALERLMIEELDVEDEELRLDDGEAIELKDTDEDNGVIVVLEVVLKVVELENLEDEDPEDNDEDGRFTVVLEAVLEVTELGDIEDEGVVVLLVDDDVAEPEGVNDEKVVVVLKIVLKVEEPENFEDDRAIVLPIDDAEMVELENLEDKELGTLLAGDGEVAELEDIENEIVAVVFEAVLDVVDRKDIEGGRVAVVLEVVFEVVEPDRDVGDTVLLEAILEDMLLLLHIVENGKGMPLPDEKVSSGQPNACWIHPWIRVPLRACVAFWTRHANAGRAPSTLSTMLSSSSCGSQIAI